MQLLVLLMDPVPLAMELPQAHVLLQRVNQTTIPFPTEQDVHRVPLSWMLLLVLSTDPVPLATALPQLRVLLQRVLPATIPFPTEQDVLRVPLS